MEAGGDLAKGALGGCRVERCYVYQVDFPRPEGFGTAEYLGNVEASLEVVQYQDKLMRSRCSQDVALALLFVAQPCIAQALIAFFAFLAAGHIAEDVMGAADMIPKLGPGGMIQDISLLFMG
jgi:hypothetical protein